MGYRPYPTMTGSHKKPSVGTKNRISESPLNQTAGPPTLAPAAPERTPNICFAIDNGAVADEGASVCSRCLTQQPRPHRDHMRTRKISKRLQAICTKKPAITSYLGAIEGNPRFVLRVHRAAVTGRILYRTRRHSTPGSPRLSAFWSWADRVRDIEIGGVQKSKRWRWRFGPDRSIARPSRERVRWEGKQREIMRARNQL